MFIISVCAAVIVILTIINCDYFCLMTNSYFIPFIIIISNIIALKYQIRTQRIKKSCRRFAAAPENTKDAKIYLVP